MELQIGKWGNSLAVRLPNALVRQLCVQEGSVLHTEVLGAQTLGISASSPAPTRRELVAARAGLELRDRCGCLTLRVMGSHRIGRDGVDVWVALDFAADR